MSDTWRPYVWNSPFSRFLESLNDLLETYELNLKEKSHRASLLEYQKKTIEAIKHRKITREIISVITYDDWQVELANRGGWVTRGTSDAVCTTDFSFNVCAICYTLVWHDTGSSINSAFHSENKPVLQEGEKFVRKLNGNQSPRL